jgi:hypothetical protein
MTSSPTSIDVIALLGASGCSKITLLRAIGGFVGCASLLVSAAGAQPLSGQLPTIDPPTTCALIAAPVCAVLAGEKQSCWNECQARRAGALI